MGPLVTPSPTSNLCDNKKSLALGSKYFLNLLILLYSKQLGAVLCVNFVPNDSLL